MPATAFVIRICIFCIFYLCFFSQLYWYLYFHSRYMRRKVNVWLQQHLLNHILISIFCIFVCIFNCIGICIFLQDTGGKKMYASDSICNSYQRLHLIVSFLYFHRRYMRRKVDVCLRQHLWIKRDFAAFASTPLSTILTTNIIIIIIIISLLIIFIFIFINTITIVTFSFLSQR